MRRRVVCRLVPLAAAVLLAPLAGSGVGRAGAQELGRISGQIRPMNQEATGQTVTGTLDLTRQDGTLVIEMTAAGLAPGMHLVHLHGYPSADPEDARCPTGLADENGDGVVDLVETRLAAGVTLIPLTKQPASLEIQSEGYPVADEAGRVTYRQAVDLEQLEAALAGRHGTPVALERRVLFIHGVPEGTVLPDSVRSLEGVPATVTVPIACADLGAQA